MTTAMEPQLRYSRLAAHAHAAWLGGGNSSYQPQQRVITQSGRSSAGAPQRQRSLRRGPAMLHTLARRGETVATACCASCSVVPSTTRGVRSSGSGDGVLRATGLTPLAEAALQQQLVSAAAARLQSTWPLDSQWQRRQRQCAIIAALAQRGGGGAAAAARTICSCPASLGQPARPLALGSGGAPFVPQTNCAAHAHAAHRNGGSSPHHSYGGTPSASQGARSSCSRDGALHARWLTLHAQAAAGTMAYAVRARQMAYAVRVHADGGQAAATAGISCSGAPSQPTRTARYPMANGNSASCARRARSGGAAELRQLPTPAAVASRQPVRPPARRQWRRNRSPTLHTLTRRGEATAVARACRSSMPSVATANQPAAITVLFVPQTHHPVHAHGARRRSCGSGSRQWQQQAISR